MVFRRVHRHPDRRHPPESESGLSGPDHALVGAVALTPGAELHPALLQTVILLGLAALCALLYRRYRKRYFLWWSAAWLVYALRIAAIITFLITGRVFWLFAHQLATGCTALLLLWSALVFWRNLRFRPVYLLAIALPAAWSLLAIYQPGSFFIAAAVAVAFMSAASLWTAWVFFRFRQQTGSRGASLLAGAFVLWGLHHLDYPLLRARGEWNPWGYYLDILFALAVGAGILLLVVENVDQGLDALTLLSGDLQRGDDESDVLGALLARPLALAGVRGSAMYLVEPGRYVRGAGTCVNWEGLTPDGPVAATIAEAVRSARAVSATEWPSPSVGQSDHPSAYGAVLPILRRGKVTEALVIIGDARDPFTALDESFLAALGRQVGAALENADLYRRLRGRTAELERLSARMVEQHEEERRRLSLELHDETAQVFSAVKLQLGILRERVPSAESERLDRVIGLVDSGMRSIRNVTDELRPSLLDDLGLLPALRALVTDFGERTGLAAEFTGPSTLEGLPDTAELAIFRAVQEGLSNVARHAAARRVDVILRSENGSVLIDVQDDGRGPGRDSDGAGRMGLAGMRERILALGGTVTLGPGPNSGARLGITLPRISADR